MYAEASARDVAKNINLRSDIVAPCFLILIEKACSYEGKKHSPDSRFRKIALLDKLREAGALRSRASNEEEQGCCTVDALSAASSSVADRLHRLPG
jgi:hypothetical protein